MFAAGFPLVFNMIMHIATLQEKEFIKEHFLQIGPRRIIVFFLFKIVFLARVKI